MFICYFSRQVPKRHIHLFVLVCHQNILAVFDQLDHLHGRILIVPLGYYKVGLELHLIDLVVHDEAPVLIQLRR